MTIAKIMSDLSVEDIVPDLVNLLDEYQFWVIGLDRNGPRLGFTPEECQSKLSSMPPKGKLDDLKLAIEEAKPKCEICGKLSQGYVTDCTYYRYEGRMWTYKIVYETHFYCEDHTKKAQTSIIISSL